MKEKNLKKLNFNSQKGQLSLMILIFAAIAIIVLTGLILWVDSRVKSVDRDVNKALAFDIAEAGIEYYRWHLAHNKQDFQDGTGKPGPYIHDFYDKSGTKLGQFSLEITPPEIGSTVVTIKSTGTVLSYPGISKTIEVRLAIPSFARFAAVLNAAVRFGEGTEVFGPIHSNGGIRFDGLAHNIVTSAVARYNDPDHSGGDEFGVHTHVAPVDPVPPAAVPNRPDVFEVGRQFPVPAVDFIGLTSDLADLKTAAQGVNRYYGASGGEGYHIILKTNDTFDLYKVTKVLKAPNGCIEVLGQQFWGTWEIESETYVNNYSFPSNGTIFFEDNVWVEGKIDTAKITIASGRFPENSSKYTTIVVNKDLLYTNYDGRDVIGLISQGNLGVGLKSADILRIDGALVAQNGRVGRYYYRPPVGNQTRCAPYHIRDTITLYGMIASNERYGFAYTDGTGYQNRNIIYDPNLLYYPPPNFPLASDNYEEIYWNELN